MLAPKHLSLVPQLEEGTDAIDSTDEVLPAQENGWRHYRLAMLIIGTVAILGCMVMKRTSLASASFREDVVEYEKHSSQATGLESCSVDWNATSSASLQVKEATEKAFKLVASERVSCPIAVGPIPFAPEDFAKGPGHKHYMHAYVKSSSDCKSKTYKLHFFIGASQANTSFSLTVNNNSATKAWQLLAAKPTSCEIKIGSASAPEAVSLKANATQTAAAFGLRELQYQMKQANCGTDLKLTKIRGAVASVVAGVRLDILADVKVGGKEKNRAFWCS